VRRRRFIGALALAPAALASALGTTDTERAPARVAAASDLKFALADLAQQYEQHTGRRVQLNLGSSGQLAQQIRHGLPVDLYMSADERFVIELADAGLTRDRGALYAFGRIAAMVPVDSPIVLDPMLRGLRNPGSHIRHFAIANPEHAPYGRAAREALERLGLWQWAEPRLVLGENIGQATQYVTSGAAQAGITALSLALAPEVARLARHIVLSGGLHSPLRQRMVLLKSAPAAAGEFYGFLQSPAARVVLRRYGFGFE
jgi:molybdate transport system substrate-binding protein